ncbi:SnoaL-like domain protein [compost metagenome]
MNQETSNTASEQEIRALLDSWLTAVTTGDLNATMAHYAEDVIAYDAILALQFKGRDAYRKHWQMCMTMCSEMRFKFHDLYISAGPDVAFSHCLNHCGGVDKDGKENASWMRMTTGYQKIDGEWKIVHEHFSAPFEMETGKALFDLQP